MDRLRFERAVDRLTTLCALAVIPVIFVEQTSTDPHWQAAAATANWWIWWAFVVDAMAKRFALGPAWFKQRSAWLSLGIIAVSFPSLGQMLASTRLVRLTRLARLGRATRLATFMRVLRLALVASRATAGLRRILDPGALPYLTFLVAAIVTTGGAALYLIEFEPHGVTLSDGLWWAAATVTTVGYGDVTPQSPVGRLLAVVVMVVGIAFTSLLTAQIAAYLNRQDQAASEAGLRAELDRLTGVIERLTDDVDRLEVALAKGPPE